MHVIVGTVPDQDFPLVFGKLDVKGERLFINDSSVPVNRGTSALAAAAWYTSQSLATIPPSGLFVGDTGSAEGSRQLYMYLMNNLASIKPSVLTFHYIQPEVNYHNRVLKVVNSLDRKPVLIADAGYMYVAKMSGYASDYDLFTPDIGELAFLSDHEAPHPFYTRGFLLHDKLNVHDKVKLAYDHGNASKVLIVKGATDYLVKNGEILETIDTPNIEYLEPIGGTGDTITGIVSALIFGGHSIVESASKACRTNRLAGKLTGPTPATQVIEIIENIPLALNSLHLSNQ